MKGQKPADSNLPKGKQNADVALYSRLHKRMIAHEIHPWWTLDILPLVH